MEFILRLASAMLISLAGIGLYFAVTQLRLVILQRANRQVDLGLDNFRASVPAILYFTTPDCAPCRTVQGPAMEQLRAEFGERLQIVTVDASERTDLADKWGVLSVPTTFIIDMHGQPRHVNNGVTSAGKLRQQLREFAGLAAPTDSATRISLANRSDDNLLVR